MKTIKKILGWIALLAGFGMPIAIVAGIFGGVDGFLEAWRIMVSSLGFGIAGGIAMLVPFFTAAIVWMFVADWLGGF